MIKTAAYLMVGYTLKIRQLAIFFRPLALTATLGLVITNILGCGGPSSEPESVENTSQEMPIGFSGPVLTGSTPQNDSELSPMQVLEAGNPAASNPVFPDMAIPDSPQALQSIGTSDDCVGLSANGRLYCFGVTSRQLLIFNPQDNSEQRFDLPPEISRQSFQFAVEYLGTVYLITGDSVSENITGFHLNRFTETGQFINTTEFMRLGRGDRELNPDGFRLAATVEQGFIVVAGRYKYRTQIPNTTGIFAALAQLQDDFRAQVGFSYQEFGLASAPARIELDERGISVNLNNQSWRLSLDSINIPELIALNDIGSALTFQHSRSSEQLSTVLSLGSSQVLSDVRAASDQLRGFSIQNALQTLGTSDNFEQSQDCPGGGVITASQVTDASRTVWTAQFNNCSLNANIHRGGVVFENEILNNDLYHQRLENISYNAFSVDFANGETLFADCSSERFLKLLNAAGLQATGDNFNPFSREVRNGYACEQFISTIQDGLQLIESSSLDLRNEANRTGSSSSSSHSSANITAIPDQSEGVVIRIESSIESEATDGVQRFFGNVTAIAEDGSQLRQVPLPDYPLLVIETLSNGQTTARIQ